MKTFKSFMNEVENHWLYGKAPRKGTVKYDIWKRNVDSSNKTKPIEPNDQKIGNAKITKRN